MTTDTSHTQPAPTHLAEVPAGVVPPAPEVPLSPADFLLAQVLGPYAQADAEVREAALKAHNDDARKRLRLFGRTMTQGDWLTVSRELDMSREEIGEDQNLVLLAFAYVKDKRQHGAASMAVLLDLTDRDLLAFHGFASELEDDEDDDA